MHDRLNVLTRIILVRHGESVWNVEGRIQGQTDIPLTPHGHAQAQVLAQSIAAENSKIGGIYTSDLKRAHDTAVPLAHYYKLPIVTHKGLREIYGSIAQGMTKNERKKYFGSVTVLLDKLFRERRERWNYSEIPGAESNNALLARVYAVLNSIVKDHAGETVILVSHGHVIRTLLMDITGEPPEPLANGTRVYIDAWYDEKACQYRIVGNEYLPEITARKAHQDVW